MHNGTKWLFFTDQKKWSLCGVISRGHGCKQYYTSLMGVFGRISLILKLSLFCLANYTWKGEYLFRYNLQDMLIMPDRRGVAPLRYLEDSTYQAWLTQIAYNKHDPIRVLSNGVCYKHLDVCPKRWSDWWLMTPDLMTGSDWLYL